MARFSRHQTTADRGQKPSHPSARKRGAAEFFGSTELRLINNFSIVARKRAQGHMTGEQRSTSLGIGIEFAEHRPYQPGDDPRQIDWSVFLRSRTLVSKVSAEERELTLLVLIDQSASMFDAYPAKSLLTRRLAAVLSGIALYNGHRAIVASLAPQLPFIARPSRSPSALMPLVKSLGDLHSLSGVDARSALAAFSARYAGKARVVLISDLLFDGWDEVLHGLSRGGTELNCIQILDREEQDPHLRGELSLYDLEDATEQPVFLDQARLNTYAQRCRDHLEACRERARAIGCGYTFTLADADLTRLCVQSLTSGGLLC